MKSQVLQKRAKKLPDTPGVYFFRNAKKKILYIGKATSLRDRVGSYASLDLVRSRGARLVKMLDDATSITFKQTNSVLEALMLEAYLIKLYKPYFNAREKDDKSYYVIVVTDEAFPRLLLVRERDLITNESLPVKETFGPFTEGGSVKEALRIIRRILPYRDTCNLKGERGNKEGKACFNANIGLCPGMCAGKVTESEYAKTLKSIRTILKGNVGEVVKRLMKNMNRFAKAEEFEKASAIKRTIDALTHIEDVSLIKRESGSVADFRIEAYDTAHLGGDSAVGVMVVSEDGMFNKREYRTFSIKHDEKRDDIASLRELLSRRLKHQEWQFPSLIVIDGGMAHMNATKETLTKIGFDRIPVVAITKDDRHKAKSAIGEKNMIEKNKEAILSINAEAHRFALAIHKKKRTREFLHRSSSGLPAH